MAIMGLDLHKRESQLSVTADDGTVSDRRIATSRERFTAVLGAQPRTRLLPERWAYAKAYRSSRWRTRALAAMLTYYNHHRPHYGIGGTTPATRLAATL